MLNRNAKIAYKRCICDVIGLISGLVDKIGLSDIEVCVEVLGMLLETGFSTIKRLEGDFSSKVNTSRIDKGLIALVVLTRVYASSGVSGLFF